MRIRNINRLVFHPDDYDRHGLLKLPLFFWGVLLLQARTWVLLILAGASRQQGEALLALFYPDRDNFWLSLLPGVPAVLAFVLSGRRARFPCLWQAWRWVLLVAQGAVVCWQGVIVTADEARNFLPLLMLMFDLIAFFWLWRSRRLSACFQPAS